VGGSALILGGLTLWVAFNFKVTTDIHHFLPDSKEDNVAALSGQLAKSELSRTMVLALSSANKTILSQASREFEKSLSSDSVVKGQLSFIEGGPMQEAHRFLWTAYQTHRLGFFAPSADAARAQITDQGLEKAADNLRQQLQSPISTLLSQVAPGDPFLTLPALFQRLERANSGGITLHEGRYFTTDKGTAIVFLGTKTSAFDADSQKPFLDHIQHVFTRVNKKYKGQLRLDQSGLNRFATRAAAAIERDMERVSTLSVILLSCVLLLLFRSLRILGLAALSTGAGVVTGCAVTLLLFGRLHGVTLAFGASLIGVAVDYVIHLCCHHAIARPQGGPRASLAAIGRPLTTGAATTIAGFLALGASSLVGLREVACFSAAGLIAAFVTTWVTIPPLMPQTAKRVVAREHLGRALRAGLTHVHRAGKWLWLVPVTVIALALVALPRVHWNDELSSMVRLDPNLVKEDTRVRNIIRLEHMHFVVALGDNESQALEANDRVNDVLTAAVAAKELASYRSVASILPSPKTQREVAQVVLSDTTLPARFVKTFTAAGFSEDAFTPFLDALRKPAPQPLTFNDLASSPLASLLRGSRLQLGKRTAIVTFLTNLQDPDALQRRLSSLHNVAFIRQSDLMNQANQTYQRRAVEYLGWGLAAVLILLAIRYREPRRTLAAFLPPVLAVIATVAVLTLAGRGLDLVTLTALVFVVSMGEDYTVFLIDAYDQTDILDLDAALVSVFLACVTTVIGFTILAMSEHPVLSSLGLTATTGIIGSVLLAPLTLWVLRDERIGQPSNHETKAYI